MEPELDSPIVGVDILQCPIEETASQLQKFPCRISDAREFTFPDPRRIAQEGTFPSPSSHSSTSEVSSDASDKSVELRPAGLTVVRLPQGSVGTALMEKRRRQNMLGYVGCSGSFWLPSR